MTARIMGWFVSLVGVVLFILARQNQSNVIVGAPNLSILFLFAPAVFVVGIFAGLGFRVAQLLITAFLALVTGWIIWGSVRETPMPYLLINLSMASFLGVVTWYCRPKMKAKKIVEN